MQLASLSPSFMQIIFSFLLVIVLLASPQYSFSQLRVTAPAWTASREWAADLDGDTPGFSLVATAAIDRGDTIAVPIITSGRVVFIGPNGNVTDVLGGFGRISAIGYLGDTLWIADGNGHRFRLFARSERGWEETGTRTYSTMFGPTYAGGDVTRTLWIPIGLAPQMRVVARVEASVASRTASGPRELARLLLGSHASGRVDTLTRLHTSRAWMQVGSFGNERLTINPLRYRDLVAMDGGGHRVVVVNLPAENEAANNEGTLRVSAWSTDGSAVFNRSYSVGLTAITTAAVDSVARAVRVTDSRGNIVPGATPPELRAAALRNANPHGSMYAPIDQLVVGRDGTTWLREDAASGRRWVVLSESGLPIGRIRFPRPHSRLLAADARFAWLLEPVGPASFQVVKYRIASDDER